MAEVSPFKRFDPAILSSVEVFWRDHYNFLKEHGYTLRKRYEPGWVPSWLNTSVKPASCEDAQPICVRVESIYIARCTFVNAASVVQHYQVLDAIRADGSFVILKQVDINIHPDEIPTIKHFASDAFASHPQNHCIPVLEIIDPPEGSTIAFLVMPLLFDIDEPSFTTIGEAVAFCGQIFEGLHYLHQQNIIHGDCKHNNIMADSSGLCDFSPHPMNPIMRRDLTGRVSYSKSPTRKPVKYYLIDFGLSQIYHPEDALVLRYPPWGGDKTVPEHQDPDGPMCDPFAVDVYCLGNFFRQYFMDGWDGIPMDPPPGFDFMRELINDMVNTEPTKRPSMLEVVSRFDDIVKELGARRLRSPFLPDGKRHGLFQSVIYWSTQLARVARRIPAVPKL
ncbi:hypothetical protein DXG01_010769 [Tephrocybe rancida]|nr:hypothetical protein DXG01_010769 [Tephrocybe rancida]